MLDLRNIRYKCWKLADKSFGGGSGRTLDFCKEIRKIIALIILDHAPMANNFSLMLMVSPLNPYN